MSTVFTTATALLGLAVCFIACVNPTLSVYPVFSPAPLPRLQLLVNVLIDSRYSDEAVQTVFDVVLVLRLHSRSISTAPWKLRILNVNRTDEACYVVHNSFAIHLTTTCLPDRAAQLRTPVLSFPVQNAGDDSNSLTHVSLASGDSTELPVLLEIASKLNWRSAVYVGEVDADTRLLHDLLRRSRTFELSDVVPVTEGADPITLYTTIADNDLDFVLVHCQSHFCYNIVTKLFHLRNEMADKASSVPWLMTQDMTQKSQSGSAPFSLSAHSTTYGLQRVLPNILHSDRLLELVSSLEWSRGQCSILEDCPTTVQQQLQVLHFHDSLVVLRYLLEHDWQNNNSPFSRSLVRVINEAKLQGISGCIHFDRSSERTDSSLYNVLEISPFRASTIGVYDSISSSWLDELKPRTVEKLKRRGRSLQQCTPATNAFRVTTIREPPFVIYDPNNTLHGAHNGPYTGLVVDMMELLTKEIEFTYKMSEPFDMKYGSINESGEGNGMLGRLMTCETDLVAAAFTVTSGRSQYIDFTEPYISTGLSLLTYKGEATSTGLWAFLKPFDFTTKLMIVASLGIISIIFAILGKLSPYHQSRELKLHDDRQRSAVPNSKPPSPLWLFYSTAMQQGPDAVPSLSGKILVAGWFFFCLVIVATYTANLAVFLTVKSFAKGIDSLDGLAAQTETVYGTVKDTSIVDYFQESPVIVYQKMYKYMISTDGALLNNVEEATSRVQERTRGDYVFIWDEPSLQYIASREPCKSQVVGRPFNPLTYALALPHGMPYRSNFSSAILKMRESGTVEHLLAKWLEAGNCDDTNSAKDLTDAEEVRLSDMLGVFLILAAAVGGSIVLAIAERLWWNGKKRLNRAKADKSEILPNSGTQ